MLVIFNKGTLQIPNSLGDKVSHWDSQNETQKPETTLNVLRESCLTENISNGTLNLISKWVEYVSLIAF